MKTTLKVLAVTLSLGLLLSFSVTPALALCSVLDGNAAYRACRDREWNEQRERSMEFDRQIQEYQNQQAREKQWRQENSDRQEILKELRRQNDLSESGGR